jgi:hypothetical protein
MPRRVSLPGADELFRSTGGPLIARAPDEREPVGDDATAAGGATVARIRPDDNRAPSGRQKHDEKITVYISPSELVELERARLTLRADHQLAVDRGRIVREALAVVLADLDAKAEDSILVRRLRQH